MEVFRLERQERRSFRQSRNHTKISVFFKKGMDIKMKNVYKILALILTVCLICLAFAGCTKPNENNPDVKKDSYKVGVIQYMSHPSLDNCYAGIASGLKEKLGDKVTIDKQIGSDTSAAADCAAYAKVMFANNYDMVIAIATPAAASAYAAAEGYDAPVIFCAVSDPVEEKIVNSLEKPGNNCTGTSDILDMEAQVRLIKAMQPEAKTIGVLYTSSESNSITQLKNLRAAAEAQGLTVEAGAVQNASDIPTAAAALVSKVDCLNNFTDNNVVTNLPVVLEAANAAGIPVYGSEIEQVKNGCLASMSIDYVQLGKITGEMAADVLKGASASEMSVRTTSEATPVVNTEVLEALGMQIPEEFASAETVTTNK